MVIVIVASSFLFIPNVNEVVILIIAVSAVFYNIFLNISDRLRTSPLLDRSVMIFIDSVLAVILIFFSGGITSPYIAILPLMIISGAFWYGAKVSIFIGLSQIFAIISTDRLLHNHPVSMEYVIKAALFLTIGVYVGLLSKSEISERKELIALEDEIENQRKQLLTLVNNIGDSIFVVDNKNRVMLFNNAASELVGKVDMLKRDLSEVIHFFDDNQNILKFSIEDLLNLPQDTKLKLKAADKSDMQVSVSIANYNVDKLHRGYIVIIRDITKDKTIEQERQDFIAVAAHELRTPLTIAQGDLSFLLAPPLLPDNPEASHLLNSAMRNIKQLASIINDMTNLSEVDTQKLPINIEPIKPFELIKDMELDFKDRASSKGIQVLSSVETKNEIKEVFTSLYIVREILSTLLSNAIKFTDKGIVSLSIIDNEEGRDGVTFVVKDSGIGISQSDQKKIFQKFFQSEDYMTRSHGGTGLGLYIAKKLSERITARLWFTSEYKKGSNFYLWVPKSSSNKKDSAKLATAEVKELISKI